MNYTFKYIITLFFLISICDFSAGQSSHQSVIWRGFEHSWTYNHRINRLGNYAKIDKDSIELAHLSASGLGADSTLFTNHYSIVESQTCLFKSGEVSIKLYGKEKQLITKRIEVSVPIDAKFKGFDQFTGLLNGFDIKAVDRADKIQLLRISIEDPEYAPAIEELRFYLNVSLVTNCQSFECSRFNQHATYDLQVFYNVIASKNEDLFVTPKTITKNYSWDRKDEYHHTPEKNYIIGDISGNYVNAFIGIKSLALTLNSAHWTVEYNNNITPLAYNGASGRMDFSTDLFFKEWQQGMKSFSAKPEYSKFSSKKRGWCVLDLGICMIQMKQANIKHLKRSGQMYWPGFNANSDDPLSNSIQRTSYPVPE